MNRTPANPQRPAAYRTYLLRCWAEPPAAGGGRTWRFSLHSVAEPRLRGFASLEALIAFVRAEVEAAGPDDEQ